MSSLLEPSEIKKLICEGSGQPLVFKGYLEDYKRFGFWKCLNWDLSKWTEVFKDEPLSLSVGELGSGSTTPQCDTREGVNMSFRDLLAWSNGEIGCVTNLGTQISASTHWAYYDYAYMQIIKEAEELKNDICWDCFGFNHKFADDCVVWVGTNGCNTPCHKDTYCYNLVAQLYGRKRWFLFPPNESHLLYPTRIPYEETSIYSKIDFKNINLDQFPQFEKSTPFEVVLEPGDVLYVPKHWWHFVESLDFSISINTWIELPSDADDKLKEALVHFQVTSVCSCIDSTDILERVLNRNMTHVATTSPEEVLDVITKRLGECSKLRAKIKSSTESPPAPSDTYVSKGFDSVLQIHDIYPVEKISFESFMTRICDTNSATSSKRRKISVSADDNEDILIALFESVTDSQVIDLLAKTFQQNMGNVVNRESNGKPKIGI